MIVDFFTKIVYYKPIKVMIDIPDLARVIINMIVRYYDICKLIVMDKDLLFILKLWSLLYYFLDIKKCLFTASYL